MFHGFKFSVGPKRGDGSPVVVAEFSAPWTDKNREAGGWQELPDTVSGNVSLVPCELAATHIEMKPRGIVGFSIDCSEASGFSCFIPTKEGVPRELRFVVKSASIHAGKELDRYGRTAGAAAGTLRISHDQDAQTMIEEVVDSEEAGEGE
jgi:hypothetical protein